jgi:hypothetical protein
VQEFKPLGRYFDVEIRDPCQIDAGTAEALDEAELHRIRADHEHDRDRRCRVPGGGGERHPARYREDRDASLNELGGEHREAVVLLIGRAIVEDEIAVLDKARISQSIYKSYGGTDAGAGPHVDPTDDRKAGLRVHRERPGNGRRRRAAEQLDELAPFQVEHAAPSLGATAIIDRPAAAPA